MRLIQGAQEVQHTFNIEGMQWPRNIDQKYASAARQIETINPSPAGPYVASWAGWEAHSTMTSGGLNPNTQIRSTAITLNRRGL